MPDPIDQLRTYCSKCKGELAHRKIEGIVLVDPCDDCTAAEAYKQASGDEPADTSAHISSGGPGYRS
jgi:hypothetical protein